MHQTLVARQKKEQTGNMQNSIANIDLSFRPAFGLLWFIEPILFPRLGNTIFADTGTLPTADQSNGI